MNTIGPRQTIEDLRMKLEQLQTGQAAGCPFSLFELFFGGSVDNSDAENAEEADMQSVHDPIIIADTGPLLRLAAASLLDAIRLTNRQVVIVDMLELEACHRHPDKPFAKDILSWIERSGDSIRRVETIEGIAFQALQQRDPTPENLAMLKNMQRDGRERAVRDYIEAMDPKDVHQVLMVHEDQEVPKLMRAAQVPLRLMTTLAFMQTLACQGMNIDLAAATRAIAAVPFNLEDAADLRLRPYDQPDNGEDEDGPNVFTRALSPSL